MTPLTIASGAKKPTDSTDIAGGIYMLSKRPSVGLLLLTAEWFAQIGATQGSFGQLTGFLTEDAVNMVHALSTQVDVEQSGIVASREDVVSAVRRFEEVGIDLLVICQITWGEDRLMLEAVREMPSTPLLLWSYSPLQHLPETMSMTDLFRCSGPVGALQASGPLKRMGKTFGFAFGSHANPAAIRQIVCYAKAAQSFRQLKQVRIGVLPYRCDQMTGTYVDEFLLRQQVGPELKHISVHDYRKICDQIPDERLTAFIRDANDQYSIGPSVTSAGLELAARASLGLAALVEANGLDAVAIDDVNEELHRLVHVRPCLYVKELFERAVVSMEADVSAAVALWLLKRLSGRAPMYCEIFTVDEVENCLLMGHAGVHDLQLVENKADIFIEPDGEYAETEPDSAWMRFRAKGGLVTLLNVTYDPPDGYKFTITQAEALSGKDKLLGSPHIYVKTPVRLSRFFEVLVKTGITQHWAVVHADIVDELIAIADILGLHRVLIA